MVIEGGGTVMCRHRTNARNRIFYRILCDKQRHGTAEVNIVEQHLLSAAPAQNHGVQEEEQELMEIDHAPVPPTAGRSPDSNTGSRVLLPGDLVHVKLSSSSKLPGASYTQKRFHTRIACGHKKCSGRRGKRAGAGR